MNPQRARCTNRFLGFLEGTSEAQTRLPVLPATGSGQRVALLRKWLDWCDKSHQCGRQVGRQSPTRLLYLSNSDSSNLRLVSGQQVGTRKYVALSHCWGELEPGKVPPYCTTRQNIVRREGQGGFSINDLPATFRDAIYMARWLGLQYLWIDSLCIIQGDIQDWEREAKRMEDVYASAYCTIAATSAVDSKAGFLNRTSNDDCVYVQDNSGRRVYVCASMADFATEVDEAKLSTRAWVLQERYLSCRTIHFGVTQTYWECGEGIYCEDLTRLKSAKGSIKHLKLDPEFPRQLHDSGYAVTALFLQSLIEDYSKRGLSKATDRSVALSGLAARISRALKCDERYGIFGMYLHRLLLWQRSGPESFGPQKRDIRKRIQYSPPGVPSWSWMAYQGSIQFMDIRFGNLDLAVDLRFDPDNMGALITQVYEFCGCQLEQELAMEVRGRLKLVLGGVEKGWIIYDIDNEKDLSQERCIVVGRCGLEYYILVVRHREGDEYERVGIGSVQPECIARGRLFIRIL